MKITVFFLGKDRKSLVQNLLALTPDRTPDRTPDTSSSGERTSPHRGPVLTETVRLTESVDRPLRTFFDQI